MLTDDCYKIAFIGSHGVGKTTLSYGLAAKLKQQDVSLDIVKEIARRCPLPINRGTTLAAQAWIIHTQIAEELVAAARHDVVICDRSVLDNYAYLLLASGHFPHLEGLVTAWLQSYGLLVHVPIVNPLQADGLRATDPTFQHAVEDRLLLEIERRNLEVLRLNPEKQADWLETVEEVVRAKIRPAQLDLL